MGKNSHSLFLEDVLQSLRTPSHLSLPSPIPDSPHQKEHNHQGKGNAFLMPLAGVIRRGNPMDSLSGKTCGFTKRLLP